MIGMSNTTGKAIDEISHIQQSVRDILTTPIGSRVMRREYGSLVPELIDQPMNGATRLRLMSATIMALIMWEPRITVSRAMIEVDAQGKVAVDMEATRRSGPRAGTAVNLSIPLR